MHAFILAGGFATRLWPLTERRAKPLLPIAGKPLLSHIVEKIPADIPVTISTNAIFAESFQVWKETMHRNNLTVRIEETRNDDEKLGTLGATAQWINAEHIDDDILLLTGDNWFGFDMQTFIGAFDGITLVAAYDIGETSKAAAFGTIVLENDGKNVSLFEEKPKEPKSSLVSTGASVLPSSVIPDLIAFAKIKPDNVGGIFEELLRLKRPVQCFRFTEAWFDIGSFDTYLETTKKIVGDTLIQGADAAVEECERIGSVVVGAHSTIRRSELENTVIFERCTIEDCVLRDCVIDDDCVLKGVDLTGKMLRAGTKLIRGSDIYRELACRSPIQTPILCEMRLPSQLPSSQPCPTLRPPMKRLITLSVALLALAACSHSTSERYQLTMNVTDSQDVAQLTQQTINVMQRRMSQIGEPILSTKSENTGSGKVVVTVTAAHKEALDALSDQMKQPFDLQIMAEAQGKQKPDITVEKFGGFVKTGITGNDLSWVEADQEPGKSLGRVHLVFTIDGRNKIAALFKQMKGKNIGIFVRNQLISKLTVETDVLKDDIVIQDIPSLEIAKIFADDVNTGIHVTVTPLP